MPALPTLNSRSAAATITAASFNSDFAAIQTWANNSVVHTDVAKTISVTHTYSATQTFSAGATFGAATTVTTGGFTVTAGGLTVTAGGLTITLGGLTVTAGGITVAAGASTFAANVTVTGTVAATTFSGSGASLTNLPAANLTGTLPAISGANLTSLNANNLAAGTVAEARLPGDLLNMGNVRANYLRATSYLEFVDSTRQLTMAPDATSFITLPDTVNDHDFIYTAISLNPVAMLKVTIGAGTYYISLGEPAV